MYARTLLALLFALALPLAALGQTSPVGEWKTIDDETGDEKSIVRIYAQDGELRGDVVRVLKPSADAPRNADGAVICSECDGERRDAPIEGMTIIWGMEADGGEWNGGRILDPATGKEYKSKMWIEDGKLHVRGYIGFAALGRTQVWLPHDGE